MIVMNKERYTDVEDIFKNSVHAVHSADVECNSDEQ